MDAASILCSLSRVTPSIPSLDRSSSADVTLSESTRTLSSSSYLEDDNISTNNSENAEKGLGNNVNLSNSSTASLSPTPQDSVQEIPNSNSMDIDSNDCAMESVDIDRIESPYPPKVTKYPNRLATPGDEKELNSLHCFVRKELLELFVVNDSQDSSIVPTVSKDDGDSNDSFASAARICASSTNSNPFGGRAGLRCVHCSGHVLKTSNASMRMFYPRKLSDLYKMVSTWQRVHYAKCKFIPPDVKQKYLEYKTRDKTRGKKAYWVTSAKQIGLVDDEKYGGGLRFLK